MTPCWATCSRLGSTCQFLIEFNDSSRISNLESPRFLLEPWPRHPVLVSEWACKGSDSWKLSRQYIRVPSLHLSDNLSGVRRGRRDYLVAAEDTYDASSYINHDFVLGAQPVGSSPRPIPLIIFYMFGRRVVLEVERAKGGRWFKMPDIAMHRWRRCIDFQDPTAK